MATPISLLLANSHVAGNVLADGDAVEVVHAGLSGASTMADLIVKMTGPTPAGTNKRIYGGAGIADRLLLDSSAGAQPALWQSGQNYTVGPPASVVTYGYGNSNQLLGVFVCTATHTSAAASGSQTGPPGSYQAPWAPLSGGVGLFGAITETFRIDSTGKIIMGDDVTNESGAAHNMVTINRGTVSPHATTSLGTGVSIIGGDDDVDSGNTLGGLQVVWRIWKTGAQNPTATEANAMTMQLINEDTVYNGNVGGFGGPRCFHYANVPGSNQPTIFSGNPEVRVGKQWYATDTGWAAAGSPPTGDRGVPNPAFGGVVGTIKPSINCVEIGATDASAGPGANPGFALRIHTRGLWDITTGSYIGTEASWGGFLNGYVISTNPRQLPSTGWTTGTSTHYKLGQAVLGSDGNGYICVANTQTQPTVGPPANLADWDLINPSQGPRNWHFYVGPTGSTTPPTNGMPSGQSSGVMPKGLGTQQAPAKVEFAVQNGGKTYIGDFLDIASSVVVPTNVAVGHGRIYMNNGHLWAQVPGQADKQISN